MVGVGNHVLMSAVIFLSLVLFWPVVLSDEGTLLSVFLFTHSLTSFMGGYSALRLFLQMSRKRWAHCALLTAGVMSVRATLWMVTIFYGSANKMGLGHSLQLIVATNTGIPLTLFGAFAAHEYSDMRFVEPKSTDFVKRDRPSRVNGPGPDLRLLSLCAGLLSFAAASVEISNILRLYLEQYLGSEGTLPLSEITGLSFMILCLLLVASLFFSVILIYLQLSSHTLFCWWQSFVIGGSLALFVFGYFICRIVPGMVSDLRVETTHQLLSAFAICVDLFFMLGSSAFQMSKVFLYKLYSEIKTG